VGYVTKIQWCDHTFNGWRGCTKVSCGCKFCYADVLSGRNPGTLGIWGPEGTRVVASESKWAEPRKWNREAQAEGVRRRVFCASLSDVFESWDGPMVDSQGRVLHYNSAATWWIPEETSHGPITMDFVRERLFDLIDETPHLDWLLLTKRPENLRDMLPWTSDHAGQYADRFWPNVWVGTSVENQETADARIPALLEIPAAVRFVSAEPLLGPVSMHPRWTSIRSEGQYMNIVECGHGLIDWLIVGGESGPQARPCDVAWVRSLRDQCRAAGVPCFVKQLGAKIRSESNPHPGVVLGVTTTPLDSKGGNPAEWPEDLRVREFPQRAGVL
jgi:protein gp37